MIILLLLACETAPVDAYAPLDDAQLLRRMSLDLRGVLPSVEELASVETEGIDALRDSFLRDPRLEDRLAVLFAEHLQTRLDTFQVLASDYQWSDREACHFNHSVGEESARLMARIAVTGGSWTDMVTADYTVANDVLAESWDLEFVDPDESGEWRVARYTDQRPSAGVLATNGLWWRYTTSSSNGNRSRGAALSDLFLCQDVLNRPVSFTTAPSLVDEDATASALLEIDACLSCHSSLDPLSAALFGFYPAIDYNVLELGVYHPEREQAATDVLGVEPAYYGEPISGLAGLGAAVAEDPRFYRCAAETMAALMWRRDVELRDFDRIEGFRQELISGDLRVKPLMKAVMDDPVYRAGAPGPGADADFEARERTARLMGPEQLATVLDDLTGFEWTYQGCNQLTSDVVGYRVLAGGADGEKVARPQQSASLTWALATKRAAEGAALTAVTDELVDGGDRRLFVSVELDDRPSDAVFQAEVDQLFGRLLSRQPSAQERVDFALLWSQVEASDGAASAWVGMVSALLRDPEFVSY